MLRSALAWILTAAVLVTLPVTGAVLCPCRFAATFRTPTAAASPPKCKCCHAPRDRAGPDRPGGEPHKPTAPGEPPCDHHCTVYGAVAFGSGERPGQARVLWDANAPAAVDTFTVRPASDSTPPAAPPPAPRSGTRVLRYCCAFRC